MKLQADLANPRSLIEILSQSTGREHWTLTGLDSDPLAGNTCAMLGCCGDIV